jgi:flagella basal body P-ring formation protein FlgA
MILAAAAVAGCLAVGAADDQIVLRDISSAFATTESVSLDTAIALAPAPGVDRRFELGELQRIAARLRLPEPGHEVCVTRPAAPLDPARLLAALQAVLPGARIEVLDYSRYSVPEGVIEFPPESLRAVSNGGMWSGSIRYGGRHRVTIWARVNVSVAATRIIATRDLPAGRPIDPDALRVESRDEFPSPESRPSRIEAVAGLAPRRPIRAGDIIRTAWLEAPKAVTRGETVQVEVREGGAFLRLPGQALASGVVGQTIPILNPESKCRFSGRIEAKGRVSIGKVEP